MVVFLKKIIYSQKYEATCSSHLIFDKWGIIFYYRKHSILLENRFFIFINTKIYVHSTPLLATSPLILGKSLRISPLLDISLSVLVNCTDSTDIQQSNKKNIATSPKLCIYCYCRAPLPGV